MTFIDAWLLWLLSLSTPGAQNVEAPRHVHAQQVQRATPSNQGKQRSFQWAQISTNSDDQESSNTFCGTKGSVTVVSQISNGY